MEAVRLGWLLRQQENRAQALRHVERCQQVDGLGSLPACAVDGVVFRCRPSVVAPSSAPCRG